MNTEFSMVVTSQGGGRQWGTWFVTKDEDTYKPSL